MIYLFKLYFNIYIINYKFNVFFFFFLPFWVGDNDDWEEEEEDSLKKAQILL